MIGPEERDLNLKQKLVAEWPGILQWFIEGCLQWQRIGLADPASVTEATSEYLDGQDLTGRWVEDNLEFAPKAFAPIAHLSVNYREWCERQGRRPQEINALVDELIGNYPEHNLKRDRDTVNGKRQRGVSGVRITGT